MTTRRLIAAGAGAASFAICAGFLRQPPLALVRLALLGAALGAVHDHVGNEIRDLNKWRLDGVDEVRRIDDRSELATGRAITDELDRPLGRGRDRSCDRRLVLVLPVEEEERGVLSSSGRIPAYFARWMASAVCTVAIARADMPTRPGQAAHASPSLA